MSVPIPLRVDFDAGHGPGNDRRGREEELTDIYSFLLWQFGEPAFQPTSPAVSAGQTADVVPAQAGIQSPAPAIAPTPEPTK